MFYYKHRGLVYFNGLQFMSGNVIVNAFSIIYKLQARDDFRQTSNIKRTKLQTWNNSHLVSQLSLPNPFNPGVKSRMKM